MFNFWCSIAGCSGIGIVACLVGGALCSSLNRCVCIAGHIIFWVGLLYLAGILGYGGLVGLLHLLENA